jgi:acyl carrier protein
VSVIDALKNHISQNYLHGESAGLSEETPLLKLNIIDSLAILTLVHFAHDEFAVSIPFDQIVPENFESIGSIARLIERIKTR